MWGQPPRLSGERSELLARVERTLLSAAFDFDFAFAFDLLGELACKERQRRSRTVRGQAGGERQSRGCRQERSDACTHGESAASISASPRLQSGAKTNRAARRQPVWF